MWNCSWLRHYAASWKVVVSIPDEVTAFFNSFNPSNRIMILGLTQTLKEIRTRNLPDGKEWLACKADNLIAI
jgi:hypothetical protein